MYGKTMKEEFIEEYMRSRIIAKTSLYSLKAKLLDCGYKDNIYFMADDLMRIEVKTA